MAARNTPASPKPDKLMRDALLLELSTEINDPKERANKVKRLRLVARALVDMAIDGDVAAAKEINDRIDGKVPQVQAIAGIDGNENIAPLVPIININGRPESAPSPKAVGGIRDGSD